MASSIARLAASSKVLGLEVPKNEYVLRPAALASSSEPSPAVEVLCTADTLLLIMDMLADADKVALSITSRAIMSEQRRLRPATTYRARMLLPFLSHSWAAGWRCEHVYIDKRSGRVWTPSAEHESEDDPLTAISHLSIVGRPDCALLLLSPFTDLKAMRLLSVFALDGCAIGDAGTAVLAIAFRNRAMPALKVLDLRRNRVCHRASKNGTKSPLPSWVGVRLLTHSPTPLRSTLGVPRRGERHGGALARGGAHPRLPCLLRRRHPRGSTGGGGEGGGGKLRPPLPAGNPLPRR